MAIIRCDAESTRAYRDSFSEPFSVIGNAQTPLEIFEAMLQARRQYEQTHTPFTREFRIVWETPSGSTATGATGQEGDTTDQRVEESHGDAVGTMGEPNATEASSTTQTADALETANRSEPEASNDTRRKSRKKKSET